MATRLSIIIILVLGLSVAMETRVLVRFGPKHNAAFPHPNYASDKFDCDRPAGCSDIHVGNCLQTNNGRHFDCYTISSPCEPSAQVS